MEDNFPAQALNQEGGTEPLLFPEEESDAPKVTHNPVQITSVDRTRFDTLNETSSPTTGGHQSDEQYHPIDDIVHLTESGMQGAVT